MAHMVNDGIISMPDKWEYPWFAAWDLAFHAIALSTVDVDFAKQQLDLMLQSFYLHPTGQMPAYEWNFSDVNPPVHAWATIFLHRTEQALGREPDLAFLARVFTKLSLNFTWWTNRKDRFGKNLYRGWLPRPGQHWRLRPQRAVADRGLPRAGRRDRLDGAVLPEHARDRRGTGDARSGLRGPGDEVRRAVPLDRPRNERGRARTACGMKTMGSTTTSCDFPTDARRG